MRPRFVQHSTQSLPARAIALLSLGAYLLVAIAAPVWHLSGAACAEKCAEDTQDAAHHCRHHAKSAHPHQKPTEPRRVPGHDEKDCSVCQILAAKLLTPQIVSLAEGSEPAIEVLPSAAPRLDRPSVGVVHSRGPPRHA